ncbi:hypothetical protein GW813_08610 [bacterium]|nr:hypothetical protein [bacterium]PJA76442.1 MAG: hypothetical protein CO151_02980 [bacterium CG_4_9_14_3_um_filter_65_15]
MKSQSMILTTTLLFVLGLGAAAFARETVKLKDGTTYPDAVLVRLTPATYIIQTTDNLFQVSQDDLAPATLKAAESRPGLAPLISNTYAEVHADGTVTSYFTIPIINRGKKAMTTTRWGLAPWERSHAAGRHYVDDRGVTLTPDYSPGVEKWPAHPQERVQVTLPLAVPLAPGERMTLTGSETAVWIHDTDQGHVFRFPGDYAEDRMVWLKVRMPSGAHVSAMTPAPSASFTHDGHEYLMWRHFFKKGEKFPLEILYTLDGE